MKVFTEAEIDTLGKSKSKSLEFLDSSNDSCIFVFFLFFFFSESNITSFMTSYRALCPSDSVFPKLHYMEDHLVNFVRKWLVGPGMMGEHGGESIHHVFNKLGERYSSMPLASTRLRHTLRQHLLTVNPDLPEPPTPP